MNINENKEFKSTTYFLFSILKLVINSITAVKYLIIKKRKKDLRTKAHFICSQMYAFLLHKIFLLKSPKEVVLKENL